MKFNTAKMVLRFALVVRSSRPRPSTEYQEEEAELAAEQTIELHEAIRILEEEEKKQVE